jgi:23S rRNA pseudouridine1911/1915/1917 synthase
MMRYQAADQAFLLDVLANLSPESSKTTLRSWLKEGRVTVDGEIIKVGTYPIQKGQYVCVGAKSHFIDNNIRILYEDKHLIVIDKPEGMLSVATAFTKEKTIHAFLKAKYHPQKIYVVHRLDQETSGVMLFVFSEQAYILLKETFEKHEIERAYDAIVEGVPKPLTGTWQSYLYEDSQYVVHTTSDPSQGRLAITHYKVKSSSTRCSWVELYLETGRKNQIRVHCQEAGHPIVGDKKYGAKSNPLKRLCLHARLLAFNHPITGKKMRFTSPVPTGFYRIMNVSRGTDA